jgi:hypothetical protein
LKVCPAESSRRFAEGIERQGFSDWWDQALSSGEAYDEVSDKRWNRRT